MHTPLVVGLTSLQLLQCLGTEWLRVTENEINTLGQPKIGGALISCVTEIPIKGIFNPCVRHNLLWVNIVIAVMALCHWFVNGQNTIQHITKILE